MSSDIANMALRSIIRQAAATRPSLYDLAYLRGQVNALRTYFEPGPELAAEAHAAVNKLRPP